MRTSIALLATVAIAASVSAESPQPETALPCFQEKCSGLIESVKVCDLTVDGSGNINFPVTNDTSATDKCLCTQNIVNDFDLCYTCGAENEKIQPRFSTQNLVTVCNANFGADTVKMPGSAASSSRVSAGSMALAATTMVLSMAFLL
ncbi:hypothetical protein BG006_000618 [Podila minutissima]|uniref:Uncharacterized protein n=1 Tax=Podila minutissima TaxID=64525 RepID=A0A9P5SRU6_9FUNG|nr:hypothetical protein BG006_000618 [Podila minutissima]